VGSLEMGPNVCTKEETYTEIKQKKYMKPYTVITEKLCIFSRCKKERTEYRVAYKDVEETSKRIVNVCCDGYEPDESGNACKMCEHGRYGTNCSRTCECENDGICMATDGRCLCRGGWIGKTCSEPCPPDRYG